jgi:hypothetical protein
MQQEEIKHKKIIGKTKKGNKLFDRRNKKHKELNLWLARRLV